VAGGETAKNSGEYGEKIVKELLGLIGWTSPHEGTSVPCVFQERHKKEGKKSSLTHGIDYIYQYKSPLRDLTKQDVLISVKCHDGYPSTERGVKTKFKEFLVDLAYAMECYPSCDVSKNKISGTNKKVISGLIFWIDRNTSDGREGATVIDKINGFRVMEDCIYETIALVDNRRAQFLYTILKFANGKYGEKNVNFFYINTGFNNDSLDRKYTGSIMPYEYINCDVIPLAITNENSKFLFLAINDYFNKEYLMRLIGLAQQLTSAWLANVIIAFPDYKEFEDRQDVIGAKNLFEDKTFANNINVISYYPDFRDEVK
jgi:hypothetical protein